MLNMNKIESLKLDLMNKETNEYTQSIEEKLIIAKKHFENLAKEESDYNTENIKIKKRDGLEKFIDEDISWTEIIDALKRSKKNKAASKDLIPVELYKIVQNEEHCSSNLARSIYKLIKLSYKEQFIPNEWKDNVIALIHKKGSTSDLDNYRGISLINTMSKVLLKVIAKRIELANETFNLIRKEQIGFIRNEEGLSGVMSLIEIVQRRQFSGLNTILCFIDLKKAYDMVPHKILIEKLTRFGFGPKFTGFMKELYDNTKMRVRIENQLSEEFNYKRGVRQGCPTSPLVFDLFIDDILDKITCFKCIHIK